MLFNTSTEDVEGIPCALAFGPDEALYIPDEGRRAIVRVSPEGETQDFIIHWRDERINGANDLVFDQEGNLYFTDPWTSSPRNPVAGVYGYSWSSGELHRIDSGMQFTNGIVIWEDRLLVAETYTRMVWSYNLDGEGRAGDRRAFLRAARRRRRAAAASQRPGDARGHTCVRTRRDGLRRRGEAIRRPLLGRRRLRV